MYRIWQCGVFVFQDLAALTCMIAVLSAARGARERKRALTVGVYAAAFAISTLNISLLRPIVERTDFDTGFLVYGLVFLLEILTLPQAILRTSKKWTSALICLAFVVGMEGLFSVTGFILKDVDGYTYHFYEAVFCAVGYTLVSLFLILSSRNRDLKIIRSTVEQIPKWLYAVIILCSFSSFFSVMGRDPAVYDFETANGIFRALSVFGILLFVGYFVWQVFSLMAKQNQILLQLQTQQRNYETVLHSDEQLRRFRHDFRNHLIVVTSMLNAGQMKEAADYLSRVSDASGLTEKRFVTENIVVDAILNSKNGIAASYGIALAFSGVVPETGIEQEDLCTVFGNLLDNAIEGARRAPGERFILVRTAVRNGNFTVTVSNAVERRVPIRNNRIRTTKADAGNHGIGLKNVAAAAKKYDGRMLLSCDERIFTADVTMRMSADMN